MISVANGGTGGSGGTAASAPGPAAGGGGQALLVDRLDPRQAYAVFLPRNDIAAQLSFGDRSGSWTSLLARGGIAHSIAANAEVSNVPEPGGLFILGLALHGLGTIRRARRTG